MTDLNQTCRVSGKTFSITEWEQNFLDNMGIPYPTLCIDERHRRRLAHRNERSIYSDKCDLCGKMMISVYSPRKPFKVYCQDCWWSDNFDATKYGRDFDFSRPFFEQFKELQAVTPRIGLLNTRAHNSEFCNITTDNKNCYLVFGGDYNEDSMYSIFNFYSRDVSDVYWCEECELLYDCINCEKCYNLKYAYNCSGCRDSAFLFECRGCSNCFGCVGLRGKEYHVFNKPYSPEEYEKKVAAFRIHTWSGVEHMKKEFKKFRQYFPHRHAFLVNCENSTGENVIHSKNCQNCFDVIECEDVKDGFCVIKSKDVLSADHVGYKAEKYYECVGSVTGQNCAFCTFSWFGYNNFYSDMVTSCHDMFGCLQMKKREFCILNKPYEKEEYEKMRTKIMAHMKETGEWGEFFPMNLSPFAYNETVAQDLFPLTREECAARDLKWHDEEWREIGSGPRIPDSIHDIEDDITDHTFVCEKTGRPYRLVPQEIKFYRRMNVPVPHFAPETRNNLRMAERLPRKSWSRPCSKCGVLMVSSYAPERHEKVYCEDCYLKEVY